MFLRNRILKICSKFTVEHPCRSVILIWLQSNFIEITLRHVFPLQICCIFSEHLFLRTHMEGYFWLFYKTTFHAHSRKQHYVKKFTQPLVWIISNIFNVTDILPVFVLLTLKRSLAQCLKVTRSTQRAAAWRNSMTRLF